MTATITYWGCPLCGTILTQTSHEVITAHEQSHKTPDPATVPAATCGAVYVSNTLGGMDVCARLVGHEGRHDWRG